MTSSNPWGAKAPDEDALDDDANAITGVISTPSSDVERQQQATERFHALTKTFASLMSIIATMHQEEDWKHLKREDGSNYTSLAHVIGDALQVSTAMARRYVQGATSLYMPLSSIAIEGTVIEIDSSTVRDLGNKGAAEVIELATERLAGIDDPEESSEIVKDTIEEVRRGPDPAFEKDTSGDHYDNDGVEYDAEVIEGKPACGRVFDGDVCYYPEGHVGRCSPEDLQDDAEPITPPPSVTGLDSIEDPLTNIIASGRDYLTPEERESLPFELREVVEALVVIAQTNPSAWAMLINYETRGIGRILPIVSSGTARMLTVMESQPWLLSRLM